MVIRVCLIFILMFSTERTKEGRRNLTNGDLITGDLLFLTHPSCNLSKAIDQTTQTGKETHFSHIGMVERDGDEIKVFHSTPKNGVFCEPLDQFLHLEEKEVAVAVYRLKDQYLNAIPQAIESAQQILGETYNHSFLITNPGYYCSEFIYKIYAPDEIFHLYPMTFKDPGNGEFIPVWIEYYSKLGISIPEGEPGCNPNGMAASDKLELIGVLKKAL
jgi:hypothetical protein